MTETHVEKVLIEAGWTPPGVIPPGPPITEAHQAMIDANSLLNTDNVELSEALTLAQDEKREVISTNITLNTELNELKKKVMCNDALREQIKELEHRLDISSKDAVDFKKLEKALGDVLDYVRLCRPRPHKGSPFEPGMVRERQSTIDPSL